VTQGLRRPPPDLIAKARDDTAAQVNRVFLTLVGTAVFCLLSLLTTSDSSPLVSNEKISVPFAGPVSFLGFLLLGPALLIILRIYLQIYVEHERRLDRIARWISAARAPTVAPDKNPLMRIFIGVAFYLLLPLVMLAFVWKAAAFSYWSAALVVVAAAVIAMHLMLPLRRLSWRRRTIVSLGAAILAGGLMLSFGPLHRPFDLSRANLSNQWLSRVYLKEANLEYANLSGANLSRAGLMYANLKGANLGGADLTEADLTGADLHDADLRGAKLRGADLTGAKLLFADLSGADLSSANLNGADLRSSGLTSAKLSSANLNGADLHNANLTDADLRGANLTGAKLRGADLTGANLRGADLTGADLRGADLSNARELTQQNLDKACGDHATELPPGLTLRNCD
jgi:uncharacterized protein YjbI with pentapeptide repeats